MLISAPQGETRMGLGNGVEIIAAPGEENVLHVESLATIFNGNVRGTEFWVGGKKVIGARQAAIPNTSEDPVSLRNVVNAVLAVMRAHGLIEP